MSIPFLLLLLLTTLTHIHQLHLKHFSALNTRGLGYHYHLSCFFNNKHNNKLTRLDCRRTLRHPNWKTHTLTTPALCSPSCAQTSGAICWYRKWKVAGENLSVHVPLHNKQSRPEGKSINCWSLQLQWLKWEVCWVVFLWNSIVSGVDRKRQKPFQTCRSSCFCHSVAVQQTGDTTLTSLGEFHDESTCL